MNAALAADQTPRPKVRAQAAELPAPTSTFVLPSPQQLGLIPPTTMSGAIAVEIDWNDVRARLHRLRAVGFHLDQVGSQWRARLLVPAGGPAPRALENNGTTDAAAVAGVLEQAELLTRR
ncbi:MAG: hypothetical protein L0Y71_17950 [Gemmataceae bacterium]|nr:hypothetical protein [Gemmataceae bacterium]